MSVDCRAARGGTCPTRCRRRRRGPPPGPAWRRTGQDITRSAVLLTHTITHTDSRFIPQYSEENILYWHLIDCTVPAGVFGACWALLLPRVPLESHPGGARHAYLRPGGPRPALHRLGPRLCLNTKSSSHPHATAAIIQNWLNYLKCSSSHQQCFCGRLFIFLWPHCKMAVGTNKSETKWPDK